MFKKKCKKCGRKIEKDYEFCPYCGLDLRPERRFKKQRDYGLLGKDEFGEMQNIGFPGLNINRLFKSLIKEVDKEFREMDKGFSEKRIKPAKGISISISTKNGKEPEIRVKDLSRGKTLKPVTKKLPKTSISQDKAKQLAKLPKKEAKTSIRRLSNKIIYELDTPGVTDIKDVIINKLENSIEIKAFSKDKAFFKLIPLKLPILNYKLDKGKLILELKS